MIIEQLSKQPEKEKKRVRLTVAYDGTNYHGWQIQNNGITIESELNRCLTDLLREPVEVIGASRTDSGVHALGNIAVFDTTSRMPAEKISYALNQSRQVWRGVGRQEYSHSAIQRFG